MAKYVYPAVFTPEKNGQFSVIFNDLEGCFTCGDDLEDAIMMAEDALALVLYQYEEDGKEIPTPSDLASIPLEKGEFVNYIRCDTLFYQKKFSKKSIRKNVTLPEWLNNEAEKLKVNFSKVLQEALLQIIQKQ